MKVIFEKWWDHDTKCFEILSYRDAWSTNGNGRQFFINDNGGRRRKGSRCFDLTIAIGYIVIMYTNFDLQRTMRNSSKR